MDRRSRKCSLNLSSNRGAVRTISLLMLAVLVAGGGGLAWAVKTGRISLGTSQSSRSIAENTETRRVKRGPLEVTLTERGSLDSAANKTLVSSVEGSTTIIRIVEEGTTAKEGEVLVELDSSKLRDQFTQQRIVVEQADAALKQAIEKREIQINQNESDINAAELKFKLAELDLEQYEKGDYEKEENDLEGKRTLAEEDLKRAQESYNFNKDNAKKGYVSQSGLEAARISVVQKDLSLAVAIMAEKVLKTYTKKRQMAEKTANAIEFKKEMERADRKAKAAMAQADADLSSAKLTAEVEQSKLDKMKEQIAACTLKAPQDGEVVYANIQSSGRGGGSEASVIMEGAQVRERQAIINLPDFSKMQVNAKIHESKIGFVREGLYCVVHTDANHGEDFNGVIQSVSSVPLSGNWPNRDLKEYATVVKLTDPVEKVRKLKPGLSAEVIIKVDFIPSCLFVPVQSVVTIGSKQYAFPMVGGKLKTHLVETKDKTGKVIEKKELPGQIVTVGVTNDIFLEIKEGLKEDEEVIMNPRSVLSQEIAELEGRAKIEEDQEKDEAAKSRKPEPIPPATGPAGKSQTGGRGGAGGPGQFAGGPGGGAGRTPGVEAAGGQRGGNPGGAAGGPGGGGPGAGGPGGGGGAGGRGGAGFDPSAIFTRIDMDSDGKLTGDEISERMQPRLAEIDTNGDKAISKEEFLADFAKRIAQGGGGGGQGGGGGRGSGGAGGPGGGGGRGAAPGAGGAP